MRVLIILKSEPRVLKAPTLVGFSDACDGVEDHSVGVIDDDHVCGPSEFITVSDMHVFSDVLSVDASDVIEHSGQSFSSSVGPPRMMAISAGDFKNSSEFSISASSGSVYC